MAITHIETVTATAESTTIGVGKASFADLQDGDVLVMLNYGYEESPYAGLPLTTEPPSGWTVLGAQRNTTGYDWHSAILYKVMTDVASEPASWDWTLAVASESTLVVSQFRGVDNSDPIDTMIDQVYLADSGGVDVYAGNNYAITDGAMAITAIGFSHTVGAAPLILTAPSGWTKAAQAEIISSDYATSAIAYKEFTAAGPVDTTEWGVALDGHAQTAHSGCLWMVTLRPSGETPAGRVIEIDAATVDLSADISFSKADYPDLANGHTVVVVVSQYNDDGYLAWSSPSGWTDASWRYLSGNDGTVLIAFKYISDLASEPASWTFGNAQANDKAATLLVLAGLESSGQPDASVQTAESTLTFDVDAPDITTVAASTVVVTATGFTDISNSQMLEPYNAPSGFDLANWKKTNALQQWGIGVAIKELSSAGAQTIGSWSNGGATAAPEAVFGATISFAADSGWGGGGGASGLNVAAGGFGFVFETVGI